MPLSIAEGPRSAGDYSQLRLRLFRRDIIEVRLMDGVV